MFWSLTTIFSCWGEVPRAGVSARGALLQPVLELFSLRVFPPSRGECSGGGHPTASLLPVSCKFLLFQSMERYVVGLTAIGFFENGGNPRGGRRVVTIIFDTN